MNRKTKTISPHDLTKPPYNLLLSYPKIDKKRIRKIQKKLTQGGLQVILTQGTTQVDGLPVLGKGCTSVVFAAKTKYGLSAVKVLRTDADRISLKNEGAFLEKVNKLGIGPKLYYTTDEFLIMELVRGKKIGDYIQGLKGTGRARKLRKLVNALFEQCFTLDEYNIAHCELSNPLRHIIITSKGKPIILDFESASSNKKYSNLTALAQSLFVGGKLSPKIRRILGIKDRFQAVKTLKEYKQRRDQGTFDEVLRNLKIKIEQ